jgi:hypothetical protein
MLDDLLNYVSERLDEEIVDERVRVIRELRATIPEEEFRKLMFSGDTVLYLLDRLGVRVSVRRMRTACSTVSSRTFWRRRARSCAPLTSRRPVSSSRTSSALRSARCRTTPRRSRESVMRRTDDQQLG